MIDYVITNTQSIPEGNLEKYNDDGAVQLIITDEEEETLNKKNIKVVKGNLIDIKKNYIRHDTNKLSKIIIDLTLKNLQEKVDLGEKSI